MRNGGLPVLAGDCDLEYAKIVLVHGRSITVPIVEVTDEIGTQGVGGPLSVFDIAVVVDMEAEEFITLGSNQHSGSAEKGI